MLTLAHSLEIIYRSYGDVVSDFVPEVYFVSSTELATHWDSYYKDSQYSWEKWAEPMGGINGFCIHGKVYVSYDSANNGTLIHELIHAMSSPDWLPVVGRTLDEGVVDYLKALACTVSAVYTPSSYIKEMDIVRRIVEVGVPLKTLVAAIFKGGHNITDAIDIINKTCVGSWSMIKESLDRGDLERAKTLLFPKIIVDVRFDKNWTKTTG